MPTIADAARTMPHLLHSIDPNESVRAELTMILGHDDDPAQDATRTPNRLRGLLTSIHPALERVLGPRLRHPAVLALLQTFGSPAQLAQAGTEQITQVMLQAAPRMRSARTLADQITAMPDVIGGNAGREYEQMSSELDMSFKDGSGQGRAVDDPAAWKMYNSQPGPNQPVTEFPAERAPDLVDGYCVAPAPNPCWVADFTHVTTFAGVVYVALSWTPSPAASSSGQRPLRRRPGPSWTPSRWPGGSATGTNSTTDQASARQSCPHAF